MEGREEDSRERVGQLREDMTGEGVEGRESEGRTGEGVEGRGERVGQVRESRIGERG